MLRFSMKAREAQIIGDASLRNFALISSKLDNLKIIELCFDEADRNWWEAEFCV